MKNSAVHAYQFNQVLSIIFIWDQTLEFNFIWTNRHIEECTFCSTLICWESKSSGGLIWLRKPFWSTLIGNRICFHAFKMLGILSSTQSYHLNMKWFWSIFVSIKIIVLIKLRTKISSNYLKMDQSQFSAHDANFHKKLEVDQNYFLRSVISNSDSFDLLPQYTKVYQNM